MNELRINLVAFLGILHCKPRFYSAFSTYRVAEKSIHYKLIYKQSCFQLFSSLQTSDGNNVVIQK